MKKFADKKQWGNKPPAKKSSKPFGPRRDDASRPTSSAPAGRRDDAPRKYDNTSRPTSAAPAGRREDAPRYDASRPARPAPAGRRDDAPRDYDSRPTARPAAAPRRDDAPRGYDASRSMGSVPAGRRDDFTRRDVSYSARPASNFTDRTLREDFVVDENLLWGRNSVFEALSAGRSFTVLYIIEDNDQVILEKIRQLARTRSIKLKDVDKNYLDRITGNASHQGVAGIAAAKDMLELDDLVDKAMAAKKDPFLLILDGLEDPVNLGAIVRSAEAAGIDGIIIPKHRAVGVNATVSKVSAGAVEYVDFAQVVNLSRVVEDLKKRGFWVIGADGGAKDTIYESKVNEGPLALVIGGEGKGLSRLVKEKCDFLLKIPMRGKINSLNASVAAGIMIYELTKGKPERAVVSEAE